MREWFHKHRWLYGILPILVLFLLARVIVPPLVLNRVNSILGSMSPLYALHIRDVDLNLWRMAYAGIDTRGILKKDASEFLSLKRFDVSVAWRELLHGRFVVDVELDHAEIALTTASLRALSGYGVQQAKDDAKNIKDVTIPFDLERVRLHDSRVQFSDIPGLPPEQSFYLSDVTALGTNLTPRDPAGISLYSLTGALQNTAKLKSVAQVRPNASPVEWSVNAEVRGFELKHINPIASRMVPMTFKDGVLSAYTAIRSEKNQLTGYVKPFFKDLHIIGDRRDFMGVKQFFYEILAALGNFVLKNNRTKAAATKVSFKTVKDRVQVDTGKVINTALGNAFGDPIAPKLDEALDLK